MLSERPYLAGEYQREKTSALTWLISALLGGFILQLLLSAKWFSGAGVQLENLFGLSLPGLQHGWIWTLLTHSFLHSTDFVFHVIFSCLVIYFLGRELMPMLGPRRFLGLYVVATVVGGLAWTAAHWRFGTGGHLGAGAAVCAFIVVMACFAPDERLDFLLLFVFPVTLRPKYIAWFLAGVELLGLWVYELPGAILPFDWNVASSAHLGGMLTGFCYHRFVHNAPWFNREDRPEPAGQPAVRKAMDPAETVVPPEAGAGSAGTSPQELRAEVDRILDKINSQGFNSLTPQERRALDHARKLLSHP
jgi:membrane associated rhomboid family serine protease